jgi:hypothetical protein
MITDDVADVECLGCPGFYIHAYDRLMAISSLASGHRHMHLHVGIVDIFINVCNASRQNIICRNYATINTTIFQ